MGLLGIPIVLVSLFSTFVCVRVLASAVALTLTLVVILSSAIVAVATVRLLFTLIPARLVGAVLYSL